MSNPLVDMEKPDVIFCIGTNMTECHPVAATRLKKALKRGAKMIVADPRRIDLADMADLYLPLRVGSDVALRQRPHMGAYGAAKAGLLAMVTNLQMELEGTRVRASIVHPGPTQTGMGWNLPPESIAPALEDWATWGQARHSYFLRAADLARAIAFVAQTPRGGFIASMELQPEAPLSSAPAQRRQLKFPEAP